MQHLKLLAWAGIGVLALWQEPVLQAKATKLFTSRLNETTQTTMLASRTQTVQIARMSNSKKKPKNKVSSPNLKEQQTSADSFATDLQTDTTTKTQANLFTCIFASENLFAAPTSLSWRTNPKSTNNTCLGLQKKYFIFLRNRFWYAQNRDLKNLDTSSIYSVQASDDEMKHFSTSLYFAFALPLGGQKPLPTITQFPNKATSLVFSFELFLPWNQMFAKNFYLNKNYFLLPHSLYMYWQFYKKNNMQFFVRLGRFLKKGKAWQSQPQTQMPRFSSVKVWQRPLHGLELSIFWHNMSLALIPLAVDVPLVASLSDSDSYFFAQEKSTAKKTALFKGDVLAYSAFLRFASTFDLKKKAQQQLFLTMSAANELIKKENEPTKTTAMPPQKTNSNKDIFSFAGQAGYLRRGAFGQGVQKSDQGRLGNSTDADYLFHAQADARFFWQRKTSWQVWLFTRLGGSYGFDYNANFVIPLNGLAVLGGLAWQYTWPQKKDKTKDNSVLNRAELKTTNTSMSLAADSPSAIENNFAKNVTLPPRPAQQIQIVTNAEWISPPAFYDSGNIKSAGYTSLAKKSYGGILSAELCSFSPHANFDAETTSYMRGEHCFRLPFDFYLYQSFAWSIAEKKPTIYGEYPVWTLQLEAWLFANLTRYAKTLPQKFSTMGSELDITLSRMVKNKNKVSVSAGIFIPLKTAKTASSHFVSHLWKGGKDIFYGLKLQSDFMF